MFVAAQGLHYKGVSVIYIDDPSKCKPIWKNAQKLSSVDMSVLSAVNYPKFNTLLLIGLRYKVIVFDQKELKWAVIRHVGPRIQRYRPLALYLEDSLSEVLLN